MSSLRTPYFREGLVAGILGYVAVAAVFVVLNVSQGLSPAHTPHVLGEALLGGSMDPVEPWAAVIAFNGVHLLATLLLGLAMAYLAHRAELDHALGMGLLFLIVAVGGWVPIFFGAVTVEFLHALQWSEVLLGSVAGAVGTLGYLGWSHRELVHALFREVEA
ncbi:MAG: hypothetical protein RLN75_09290 [Longimicrobiales bacterium]